LNIYLRRKYPKRTFCFQDVKSLRTFCQSGHFSIWTFCSSIRIVLPDVLSLWTFCPTDVMSLDVRSLDVLSPDVLSPDVLFPGVLSLRTFCNQMFCLGTLQTLNTVYCHYTRKKQCLHTFDCTCITDKNVGKVSQKGFMV
jgi:hypothetical protein